MTPTIHGPFRARKRRWWQYISREALQASVFVIVLAVVLFICRLVELI